MVSCMYLRGDRPHIGRIWMDRRSIFLCARTLENFDTDLFLDVYVVLRFYFGVK